MTRSPSILIGMPLFEGWEHVGETLLSIQRQTYRNFRVLISVDGNDQRSYDACAQFLSDPRFERVLQRERLNWDGNMTWLGSQLREDFFCYWQHDDHCDPEYLETLMEHAVQNPQATSIYCDMKIYGDINRLVEYPSVTGSALERVNRQITNYNPAVIRCLVRADAMRASLPITVVSTWCMTVARLGEMLRVPKLMYYRRIRPGSLTHTLPQRPDDVLWRDALDWCLGVLQNLYPLVEAGERDGVFSKAVDDTIYRRLRDKWQYDFSGLDHGEHVRFASEFLAEARDRFGLVPFTELLAGNDPREALQAHGKQGEPATGENLVLAALMLDLPAFVSAVKRGGAS